MSVWISADPGGKGSSGLALLNADGIPIHGTVSSVDEAIAWITDRVGADQIGEIGIDAPLWWSSGPGGGRLADDWLRTECRIASGTVQPVNSLRGAAIAQGLLHMNEYERDALIGAVAAREGFEGRWSLDLTMTRSVSEQNPAYWLSPVHYIWPGN